MIKKHSDKVIPAVFIGALLLIWELCVRIFRIPLYVLPSPVSVVQALIEERVGLWGHAVVTTEEALIGIGIALILSLALGVLMDCFPAVRQGLYPILVVTQTVPMIVMAPILIIYMGFGMLPKIFTVVLMCFFSVAVSLADGLGRVDSEYVHLVRSYGAVKWAWEEGQKSQNYAIEEQENLQETTQSQQKAISVRSALYETAHMAAKLRNVPIETLIAQTTDNFWVL